ncbi:MAG: S24 family peptidase [Rhodospirillales bacterium]
MKQTLGERTKERRQDLGLSQAKVAQVCGVSQPAVDQVERNVTKRPKWLPELAKALGVSSEWLLHGVGSKEFVNNLHAKNHIDDSHFQTENAASNKNAPPDNLVGEARIAHMAASTQTQRFPPIKVLGTAQGGPSGAFLVTSEEAVAYVDRTPALNRIPGCYAVYVVGESMEPVIPHGELRFIDPVKPPSPGDFVLIQQKNGEHDDIHAFVKQLVRRTEKKIITKQFNPEAKVEFSADTVTVHRIVPWNEVHGA